MQVDNYNREVNLLDIVNRGRIMPKTVATGKAAKNSFSQELVKATQINISKHARERLHSRGIELSDTKMAELSAAIDKAAGKGSRETLILDESAAYVVSIPNRTIITAFGRENLREGVITAIDSAIVL
ncbi:MAG: flagellar biosynthesis protein [candidate division Zixibacteria bacterium]|jgi:flagellar operon protein|nr:flagellar biosynthesis protein [candidate division Zixibacteria bacterium]